MKVLLINQVFWPDVAATAQYGFDLARCLSLTGRHEVTVVSSRSLYSGEKLTLPREEWIDGVRVVRCGRSVFGRNSVMARLLDFLLFHFAAALQAVMLPRQNVIICLTTPPLLLWTGLLISRIRGGKVICWSMDLYPEVPVAAGILRESSVIHQLMSAIDRKCLRSADKIVVLGRCMRERLNKKGADPNRVCQIDMWTDIADPHEYCSQERNVFREMWGLRSRFVIQYAGNFGIGHDAKTIFGAMARLRENPAICWLFVGGGSRRIELESFVASHNIRNVLMKPYQSRADVGALLAAGDVHLVSVADGFEGLLVPSKFYGALGSGRPVIYVGPDTCEVARVVNEERCGVVVRPGDVDHLCKELLALSNDPAHTAVFRDNAIRACHKRFSMKIAEDAWCNLLRELSVECP